MRPAQLFPSSPSLSISFNTSRLISFIPLKSRQAETVNANISLREIRSIFTNPSYPSCQNVMCVTHAFCIWCNESESFCSSLNLIAHRPLRYTEETILTAHYIETGYTVTDAIMKSVILVSNAGRKRTRNLCDGTGKSVQRDAISAN